MRQIHWEANLKHVRIFNQDLSNSNFALPRPNNYKFKLFFVDCNNILQKFLILDLNCDVCHRNIKKMVKNLLKQPLKNNTRTVKNAPETDCNRLKQCKRAGRGRNKLRPRENGTETDFLKPIRNRFFNIQYKTENRKHHHHRNGKLLPPEANQYTGVGISNRYVHLYRKQSTEAHNHTDIHLYTNRIHSRFKGALK